MARAAWRPSRIAQTTSDWPRRMSPAAKTLSSAGAIVVDVGRDIAARVELDAEARRACPRAPGGRSPWRAARDRPSARTRVPGIGCILASTRTQCSFFTTPFSPENFCVTTEKSRSAPSWWLDEVRSFSGQFGQVSSLSSFSGGLRHDFELRHRQRALADRGADAVGAGVAAADDHDMLAAGEDGLVVERRLAARRGGSAAAGNPWRNGRRARSRPGIGRSRGFSAPPASSTAS